MPIIDGIYHGPHPLRRGRVEPRDRTEKAQLERVNAGIHHLTDQDLAEIVADWHAGIAREVADRELKRRAGLTAHQRLAETAARARAAGC